MKTRKHTNGAYFFAAGLCLVLLACSNPSAEDLKDFIKKAHEITR